MEKYHSSTGTAADFVTYNRYHDSAGYDYLSRVATASEEWIFGDWDGEKYSIRFDKNFSKKHLFTFSKKTEWAADDGKKHESLYNKLEQVLNVRSNIRVCADCGHRLEKHQTGSKQWTNCKQPIAAATMTGAPLLCGCRAGQPGQSFKDIAGSDVNAYFRWKSGKPDHDVLGGAYTDKNSAIVLNYVPKAEFEAVVVASIRAHEKPSGWKRGDPLSVPVGQQRLLEWDFGPARNGVIVTATVGTDPSTWPRHQKCAVKAEKTWTFQGWQTWKIFHLEHVG